MKENDIEEARERLEKRIKDIWFSTTYSQEQEEKDLKILLSDYKRALKENEELKADNYELNNRITDLLENIPIQKVKDKIKEEKMPLTIVGGRRNKKILEYGISLGRMQVLQELIEEGEKK